MLVNIKNFVDNMKNVVNEVFNTLLYKEKSSIRCLFKKKSLYLQTLRSCLNLYRLNFMEQK